MKSFDPHSPTLTEAQLHLPTSSARPFWSRWSKNGETALKQPSGLASDRPRCFGRSRSTRRKASPSSPHNLNAAPGSPSSMTEAQLEQLCQLVGDGRLSEAVSCLRRFANNDSIELMVDRPPAETNVEGEQPVWIHPALSSGLTLRLPAHWPLTPRAWRWRRASSPSASRPQRPWPSCPSRPTMGPSGPLTSRARCSRPHHSFSRCSGSRASSSSWPTPSPQASPALSRGTARRRAQAPAELRRGV